MYIITSAICGLNEGVIKVTNQAAINDVETVIKLIFTPINAMIVLSVLGNTFGKVKDKVIGTDKAGKRIIILLIVFIAILIFEAGYIGDFMRGLLG